MVEKHLGDGGAGELRVGEGSLRKWSAKNEEIRCNFPGKERTSQGQRQCGSWRPGVRIIVVWGEREERGKGCGAVRSQSPWWRQSALSNLFKSEATTEFDEVLWKIQSMFLHGWLLWVWTVSQETLSKQTQTLVDRKQDAHRESTVPQSD